MQKDTIELIPPHMRIRINPEAPVSPKHTGQQSINNRLETAKKTRRDRGLAILKKRKIPTTLESGKNDRTIDSVAGTGMSPFEMAIRTRKIKGSVTATPESDQAKHESKKRTR